MASNADIKILVVDDNPGTLYATARVLRSAGFTVLEAATGREGLDKSVLVDLVVLDINLPDIDGFEVCRLIRENSATARTPVIHLSATFVEEQDKVRGLDYGADGYLTHPVEAPVLLATVSAFLRARHAEKAMRESEAKFRAIFDQVPHGIALISQDFVYLEINPAMCEILGRPREQIIGKHNSAFMPLGHERDVVAVAEELKNKGVWKGNTDMVRSDAQHVALEWSISRFSVTEVRLAIVTDVSERRAIEAERERLLASERAARAEAERANRLKDDFLATLSHELRTPLNAIVGWAEILRRGKQDPELLAEGLEAIERNVKSQAQLIADLLDVSRITSGKMRLEMQEVDAVAIVAAALDSSRAATSAKEIRLAQRLEAGPKIMADPHRLQQIVWNLVNNAVKFTPRGGRIEVGIRYTDTSLELTVEDTGQGISAEFLPRIFDRFSQEDPSSRRSQGGLGIGLAIVKSLVEMHGGTIHVASEGLGKGARFTVSLPLKQSVFRPPGEGASGNDQVGPDVSRVHLQGVKVLVVDDDADARRVMMRLLSDFGATVADAESAVKAIAAIETFDPHVLVSDIGMPGQDGYDLLRQVRGQEAGKGELPAIALTAFAGEENRRRALDGGFQTHFAKPVNPAALVLEIAKLAGR